MSPRARKVVVSLTAIAAVLGWAGLKLRTPPSLGARLRTDQLEPRFEALKPLHVPLRPAGPGDWLAENREAGQSFAAYTVGNPVRATVARRTIYLEALGDFTPAQQHLFDRTADYVARFFQLPVKRLPPVPESELPAAKKRVHAGVSQLLTTWVLTDHLAPRRPDDAVAVMALTSIDLYPGEGWNFVFGEASLKDRVGVWSLARNGDPEKEPALALLRSVKTAVHELGHMLSLQHCVAFACVMNGSNSLQESDPQPLAPCPVCLQKLSWNIGFDPQQRFEELAAFERDAGFVTDAAFTERELAAWRSSVHH